MTDLKILGAEFIFEDLAEWPKLQPGQQVGVIFAEFFHTDQAVEYMTTLSNLKKEDKFPEYRPNNEVKWLPRHKTPLFCLWFRVHPNFQQEREAVTQWQLEQEYPKPFWAN